MTRAVPSSPSVLDTTVLSNFASIDHVEIIADLDAICTVPVVSEELRAGVETHPYLEPAVAALRDDIPVTEISAAVTNRDEQVRTRLDPGEAQAFALAAVHDGRLLTDDGDARFFAKNHGVTVVGSVGILLTAIDAGRIDQETANEWLQTWIDDFGYYVPYRTVQQYR